MALGSRDNSEFVSTEIGHSKTETYNNSTSTWTIKSDYPYRQDIRGFEIVQFSSNFLVFGGVAQDNRYDNIQQYTTIAKFNPDLNEWSMMGNLQFGRNCFSLIKFEDKYLITDGNRDKRTETCEITGDQIECKSRELIVDNDWFCPAMMIVSEESISQCKKQT